MSDKLQPSGLIESNWKKEEGVLTMNVVIPANTIAIVYVPGKNVTEGGMPTVNAEGVTFLRMEKDIAVYKVESGNYSFGSTLD
jgi:alpha-L-rhamnosidase